jgi:hypothetical protein
MTMLYFPSCEIDRPVQHLLVENNRLLNNQIETNIQRFQASVNDPNMQNN